MDFAEFIKWAFEGIGTAIFSAIIGFFSGFAGGIVSFRFKKINQMQMAGNGATQFQAEKIINQFGITEERAREIAEEQIQYALMGCTKEAYQIGKKRILLFEERYMQRLKQTENALQAFAEPAFQVLLRQAQQSAASTEREKDYNLLAELLVWDIRKGKDRKVRTGVYQAVEIASKIDDDSLCGLTVAHAFMCYSPTSGKCSKGLDVLDKLFEKLIYQKLPVESEWLDHLDILDAVRIIPSEKMSKVETICLARFNGYICVGIKKDSTDFNRAMNLLNEYKIGQEILVPNDLLEGYFRLDIFSDRIINQVGYTDDEDDEQKWFSLTDEQKDVLKQIWKMYSEDVGLKKHVKQEFMKLWDSYDSLNKLRNWWETIPQAFELTSVGHVLAQTNAKRCDSTLPDMP